MQDGFHRVDWSIVQEWVEAHVESVDWDEAWSETALLWAQTLRDDLGGDYSVLQSKETILVCEQSFETSSWLLQYTGDTATKIRRSLRSVAWRGALAKDLFIVFSDQDDYYQYVACHLADGENPSSGGMCINSGYTHIAMPWTDQFEAANTIVHELAHDCVAHLSLPLWLNEGVAVTLEKSIGPAPRAFGQSAADAHYGASIGWRSPTMWDELAERHFAFWNEENIQTFWAGTSFHIPEESNQLSYSLAEVMVKLLTDRGTGVAFCSFLELSKPDDAGQSAALELLKADLGEIAGTFLGPGNWRPQRKAIKACWEAVEWNRE